MSKTCPKCGAEYNGRPAPNQHDYWCGSTTWVDGDFYQSPECVRRDRDQLLERIKQLEEAGDALAEIAGKFGFGLFVNERKGAWNKAKGQP